MSDTSAQPARPVSLFTIVFLLSVFGLFLLVIRWFYAPARTTAFNAVPENLPKELEWKANPEPRRKVPDEAQDAAAKQAGEYAWLDKSACTVQLPIQRAMELTAQRYAAKK